MTAIITFDVDWAPDCAIDFVVDALYKFNVKSTWFITHMSPAIERLMTMPTLFEIGIHPNFMPSSSQGNSPREVLDYCMNLAPKAKSMRTHCLFQSSPLIDLILETTPIRNDISLFAPLSNNINPFHYHRFQKTLLRFPYFWEDGYIFGLPKSSWESQIYELESHLSEKSKGGLKIFNFHPIHVMLNSDTNAQYEFLKVKHPDVEKVTREDALNFTNQNSLGARDYFLRLISLMHDNNQGSFIDELAKNYAIK